MSTSAHPTQSMASIDSYGTQSLPAVIAPVYSKQASCAGHGTLEILKVTQVLGESGIPCCLAGMSALIYYGATLLRCNWEICVPTHQCLDASILLKSQPYCTEYITAPPDVIQPKSLAHTYSRFQLHDCNVFFQIFPSDDCHLDCKPITFMKSHNGLPYPRLDILIQSLIDSNDRGALSDIIDGTDVTEDWGNENLDLTGTVDVAWRKWKNDTICAQREDLWNVFSLLETRISSRREIWENIVRGKESRLGYNQPKELFATRFRLHGSQDPWLTSRDAA